MYPFYHFLGNFERGTTMITTNKVAIYVRVSTTNQVEEGYSIDEQKDKLSSYCDIKDWNVYKVYTDGGFSGSNTDRPALESLIKDAKKENLTQF